MLPGQHSLSPAPQKKKADPMAVLILKISMMSTPYLKLKAARPALTSFAVQLTRKKLITEAEAARQTSSGLHIPISSRLATASAFVAALTAFAVKLNSDIVRSCIYLIIKQFKEYFSSMVTHLILF